MARTPANPETSPTPVSSPESVRPRQRLAPPIERVVASLGILCGFSRTCPACADIDTPPEICSACTAESTGPAGPWNTTQISSLFLQRRIPVRYFGHYELRSGAGRCRIADLLGSFKYGGRRDVGRELGRIFTRFPPPMRERFDAIIPIPLTAEKLHRRGFNQAAWLARPAGRALRVPLRAGLLRRTSDQGGPQAGRSGVERRRLGPNPFSVSAQPSSLNAARILLIDDVCTTGTTIAQAARALLCAGALHVEAVVLLISDRNIIR